MGNAMIWGREKWPGSQDCNPYLHVCDEKSGLWEGEIHLIVSQ